MTPTYTQCTCMKLNNVHVMLTRFNDNGSRFECQFQYDHADISCVKDLCSVPKVYCPQLRRWVEKIDPTLSIL